MPGQIHEGDQGIKVEPASGVSQKIAPLPDGATPLSGGTIVTLASCLPYRALSTMAILAPKGSTPEQQAAAMRVAMAHSLAMGDRSRKPEPGSSE